MEILMTLHQFLLSWLTDEKFRDDNPELKQAMENHGLADVTGEDVHQAMMLVADELPPYEAQQMGSYLNAPSGAYNDGAFNITQGGSAGASGAGSQAASQGAANLGASGGAGTYVMPDHYGNAPLDDAVREIQFITNNFTTINETNTTNIDDRDTTVDNSVRQLIETGGGDLDQEFTSNIASGDGSASGDGAAVQSGDGNVAGIGNVGITGDNNQNAFGEGSQAGTGNQAGDGSAFGEGAQIANAIGSGNQAVTGTGNTTSQFGDAESTGNIAGGGDVNAVGNVANSGDDANQEVQGNQAAGDDATTEADIDITTEEVNFESAF